MEPGTCRETVVSSPVKIGDRGERKIYVTGKRLIFRNVQQVGYDTHIKFVTITST